MHCAALHCNEMQRANEQCPAGKAKQAQENEEEVRRTGEVILHEIRVISSSHQLVVEDGIEATTSYIYISHEANAIGSICWFFLKPFLRVVEW